MTKRNGTWQVIIAVVSALSVAVGIKIMGFIFDSRYINYTDTRGWEMEEIEPGEPIHVKDSLI